ncbi:hypothetical protein GCM10023144_29590 [Pigmentiphaga soli]|uniref:Uncharacterized protein n=1 Tax=Pigmentiphaga soli TaxID=1007095 RepID=A0ABP8H8H2_9BURK
MKRKFWGRSPGPDDANARRFRKTDLLVEAVVVLGISAVYVWAAMALADVGLDRLFDSLDMLAR